MGKLTDLTSIYETYQNKVIQELNISEPTATVTTPTAPTSPSQTHAVIMNEPSTQNEEEECIDSESNNEMANSEVFNILRSANDLMNILQSSKAKIEPWQLSKLVKANDYVSAVKSSLEYDSFKQHCSDFKAGMEDLSSGMDIVGQIKHMLAGEDLNVNEEILRQVIFNIECILESSKK